MFDEDASSRKSLLKGEMPCDLWKLIQHRSYPLGIDDN